MNVELKDHCLMMNQGPKSPLALLLATASSLALDTTDCPILHIFEPGVCFEKQVA